MVCDVLADEKLVTNRRQQEIVHNIMGKSYLHSMHTLLPAEVEISKPNVRFVPDDL